MAALNPFPKSTVRIISSHLLIFLTIICVKASPHSPAKIPYADHCNSVVQESPANGDELEPQDFLQLHSGSFKGGQKFLNIETPDFSSYYRKTFSFRTNTISETDAKDVLKIQATLTFYDDQALIKFQNSSSATRRRQQVFYFDSRGNVGLELQGFWSKSAGRLCMVGAGHGMSEEGNYVRLSAVVKLNYPKSSNLSTSIVTGTVESLDPEDDSSHFEQISVLGFSQKLYRYSPVSEFEGKCTEGDPRGEKSLALEPEKSVCSMLEPSRLGGFQLNYKSNCSAGKCSPFDGLFPGFMTVGGIQCSTSGKMRMYLQFSNSSYIWYGLPLIPETVLVAEGVWDEKKNQLCVIGCRLKNFGGSLVETLVGDCSVGLTLTFSKVLSLKMRSSVLGSIWSFKKANETGYFNQIGFQSSSYPSSVSGVKYEYTELGRARNLCEKKNTKKKSGKSFPNGSSVDDMRFDMSLSSKARSGWGSATPLSFDEVLFDDPYSHGATVITSTSELPNPNATLSNSKHTPLNVSYSIGIAFYDHGRGRNKSIRSQWQIFAEGIYDAETGNLCMVGCRSLGMEGESSAKNTSLDCEILINIDLAPFNSKEGQHLKGTITSLRKKSDSLYFEELELVSNNLYGREAKETVWRMDLEITMVIISLTLACVFIGLQLYHVKKNPDVLPSLSILMLVVLTLGHMIPLVLNFEALFLRNPNRQNVLLWSGGWLEVNEVLVRIITMVAFLLQFRLLQLTFSARLAESSKKGFWAAEKRAIYSCLLLYLVGGLVAWFVHSKKIEVPMSTTTVAEGVNYQNSGWKDVKSFAGLVLDGFLLPQILLNLFSDSKDKALATSYYVGTTIVRLLPHGYDAYRGHRSLPHVNASYIYADPGWDLYSAAWDVIIPCGGLLFALIIFLQQRLGGAFILPQRFRWCAEYEKIPVVSG